MASKKNDTSKAKTKSKSNRTVSETDTRKGQRGGATPTTAATPRAGDLIVIDSAQVGSPPREGEILQVIERGIGVAYRVKWGDGHESLISPGAGAAHVIRKRATRQT